MKLSDLRNRGVQFIRLKEAQHLTFFYVPRIGVEPFWVYRIPGVVELQDEKTGKKNKVVMGRRFLSPGLKSSYFSVFRQWLKDRADIPETTLIWDLKQDVPGAMTKFTKAYVVGSQSVQEDWKQKFQVQQEVYAGIVDFKDSSVKLLSMTGGVWNKWKKEMAYQMSRLGTLGDPEVTPVAYVGTYDAIEKNAQEKYQIRMDERIQPTDAIKSQLAQCPVIDIRRVVGRDHYEDVKKLVLTHVVLEIMELAKKDRLFEEVQYTVVAGGQKVVVESTKDNRIDPEKREFKGFGGDTSFNPKEMESAPAKPAAPVDESKVAFPYGSAPPAAVAAQTTVAGQIAAQAEAQAQTAAQPSAVLTPPAAVVVPPKRPPLMVDCIACKKPFELTKDTKECPHCHVNLGL